MTKNQQQFQIYPSSDILVDDKVNSVIENANVVRLKYVNDFILQLEQDYIKYGNKKRRYSKLKNIIMVVDILFGSLLFIIGLILELTSLVHNVVLSLSLGVAGMLLVATLPLTNKITELAANKNRNFEVLAVKKLNMCKEIFSKSIDDQIIGHEEMFQVLECKRQYEAAKNEK